MSLPSPGPASSAWASSHRTFLRALRHIPISTRPAVKYRFVSLPFFSFLFRLFLRKQRCESVDLDLAMDYNFAVALEGTQKHCQQLGGASVGAEVFTTPKYGGVQHREHRSSN